MELSKIFTSTKYLEMNKVLRLFSFHSKLERNLKLKKRMVSELAFFVMKVRQKYAFYF